MKSTLISFMLYLCLTGSLYAQNEGDSTKDYVQLSEPVEETAEYRVFGSAFNSNLQSISLPELVTDNTTYDNKTVTTEGVIVEVCQKKGCFFMLESEEQQARISFKDYGFFIPTNTTGARVKLNGTFKVKMLSEEKARHYAEDAGSEADTITGPQKEYALVATSVVIFK